MSRSICIAFAAFLGLAACNLARCQDVPASTAPAGDDVAALKAVNAARKKEVADAKHTIAELQTKLAEGGAAATPAPGSDATAIPAPTNAAPAEPLKALPLDSTNEVAAPGAPATDAGPSKNYTVVKGDSLWKIAHKMYPHDTLNGEDKIREANKDVFNGKYLKPGQVLVIPQ
jgi:nucleoid-associated protein YgaU